MDAGRQTGGLLLRCGRWRTLRDGCGRQRCAETSHDLSGGSNTVLLGRWRSNAPLRTKAQEQLWAAEIYALSLDGEPTARPLVQKPASEVEPAVSPDGRWLAYTAERADGEEVYVRPFPQVDGGRWRISTDGGDSPVWSRDGRQLFYIARGRAASVPVETAPSFRAGTPTVMFDLPPFYRSAARIGRQWDIAPDGERFLIMNPGEAATSEHSQSRIVVVLNWVEELKRLVPAK